MIAWAILIAEFGLAMNSIFLQRASDYTVNEIFLSKEEMTDTEINLGDFDFKFAFGLEVKDMVDFDMSNNPYVEIIGYIYHI